MFIFSTFDLFFHTAMYVMTYIFISGSGRSSQVSFGLEQSVLKTAAAQVPNVCQQHVRSGQAVLQRPAGATRHPEAAGGGGPDYGGPVSHRLMRNPEC